MNIIDVKALSWPSELQNPGPLARFCQDVPFIGIVSRRRRAVRRQLAARRKLGMASVWGEDNVKMMIASELAELVRNYCNWPNPIFIPQDPCEVVISDSCDGLQSVCVLSEICRRFDVSEVEIQRATASSFGGLVEYLKTKLETRKA